MIFSWNEDKNKLLKETRGICFEILVNEGTFLDVRENGSTNHKNQLELHILYNNYIYKIPFVIEANGNWFLKTAFASRDLAKFYGLKK
jgi:hypothetical protein